MTRSYLLKKCIWTLEKVWRGKQKYDCVIFAKQVPLHPRERLARESQKQSDDDIILVKQVPLQPRERLKKKN